MPTGIKKALNLVATVPNLAAVELRRFTILAAMVVLHNLTLSSLFPVHGMPRSFQTGKAEIHPTTFMIQVFLACLNYQAHSYIGMTPLRLYTV